MSKQRIYTETELQFLKEYLGLSHFSVADLQVLVNEYGEDNPNDLQQLDRTVPKCKYYIEKYNEVTHDWDRIRKIGYKECRQLLGDEYLSALDRACFHCSTSRELDDGTEIYFDNYAILK